MDTPMEDDTMEDDTNVSAQQTVAGSSMTKPKPVATHPKFIEMAMDAIIELNDKKGSSVQAIGSYIVEKYKLDPEKVKQHMKPALAKGLEQGLLVRPKGSDAKGFIGRFKIYKGKLSEENKEKKKKKKKITKSEADKGKKKKTAGDKVDKKIKKTPRKSSKDAKSLKKSAKSPRTATKPKTEGTVRKKASKPTSKPKPKLAQVKATPSKAKKKTLAK
ncbi:hypothetical protein CHS0354_025534 [Potamilus streckersoni]|uniref:H15 domain-containing protein n=1 Tax=Potamilus streckersoni TaxID=2493646 RepID=A0AAE0SKZ7_9BIVA|nr:hypothetical protein CHS0354_025534 [Potamilus streckersoni]